MTNKVVNNKSNNIKKILLLNLNKQKKNKFRIKQIKNRDTPLKHKNKKQFRMSIKYDNNLYN